MERINRCEAIRKSGRMVMGAAACLALPALSTGFSGEMKNFVIKEQARFIDTTGGVIVVTGCAHPGITAVVERAVDLTHKEIFLVLGGFHLVRDSEGSIGRTAERLKALGVRHVAPTHCSGVEAREILAEAYGCNYINPTVA